MKQRLLKWGVVSIAIALAPACVCDSDFCPAGGAIPIGGGGSSSAPSRPFAPPVNMAQEPETPEEETAYETHGAVTAADCQRMLRRFQQEGRRVRLVKVRKNPYNRGGGVLEYICYFDGEDANPESTPFEDTRFPRDDSAFP